jgi:hypothetical protein
MSARQVIALAVAVGALVLVLIVGTGLGWWNTQPSGEPPAKRLIVRTHLSPRPAFFGDLVTAQVEVQIDRAIVDPKSVHVVASFVPFVPTGRPTVTQGRVGRHETLRYGYSIQCVSDDCLPTRRDPRVTPLKPVVVTAMAGGKQLRATATWPRMSLLSRLQKGEVGGDPNFHRPRTVPAPSYAVSPGGLADALTVAAGLLAFAAVALLGRELMKLLEGRRRRGLVQLTALEEALAYTRDAARRPDPTDRRKALELLAQTLDDEGVPKLADTAGDVAWAEEPPSPDRALELADEVEAATRNGG